MTTMKQSTAAWTPVYYVGEYFSFLTIKGEIFQKVWESKFRLQKQFINKWFVAPRLLNRVVLTQFYLVTKVRVL